MANSILTPTQITREALRILHQKLNFVGNVNRQYDDRFAQGGAKIGTTLNVRMPAKYVTGSGATISAYQDHVERSTPLSVSSQTWVAVSFTTAELTMSLDDFSDRIIKPAMNQMAAKLESDALAAAYKLVNNYTNATTDGLLTFKRFSQGSQKLTENLAPLGDRTALLTPYSRVEFMDVTKSLFHSAQNIQKQYREGIIGTTGGFDVYENTLLASHTTGSYDGTGLTNGTALGTSTTANAWVSQTTLSIDGVTAKTLKAGDIITFSGVYAVHPESKANTGKLATFVVQSDITLTTAATSYDVTIKPGLIYGSGNAYQNCTLSGVANTDGLTVTLKGAVSSQFGQDLQFHKDAFVFATADLEDVSQYGAWGARESLDGISMRLARQYAIGTDTVPCRIDVLWGFAGLYPELANRHMYELDIAV